MASIISNKYIIIEHDTNKPYVIKKNVLRHGYDVFFKEINKQKFVCTVHRGVTAEKKISFIYLTVHRTKDRRQLWHPQTPQILFLGTNLVHIYRLVEQGIITLS